MRKKVKFAIILLIASGLMSSCRDAINFQVTDLTLLDHEQTFSGNGSKVTVVGMLHAVIETNMELIAYAKEHRYNLRYIVKGCSSDVELFEWSAFYRNKSKENNLYVYDVIFDYKSPSNWMPYYNLVKQREDLCFNIIAANMNFFSFARSDVVSVPMTYSLFNKLQIYEMESRPIRFQADDSCKEKLCIPDYAM